MHSYLELVCIVMQRNSNYCNPWQPPPPPPPHPYSVFSLAISATYDVPTLCWFGVLSVCI